MADINDLVPRGMRLLQEDTFTSSNTWTKVSGAKWVVVRVIGSGGGGGGGSPGAASTYNGNGGGGGIIHKREFPASMLGATESVVVGAAPAGGASNTIGTAGNYSAFGVWVEAPGGKPGTAPGSTYGTAPDSGGAVWSPIDTAAGRNVANGPGTGGAGAHTGVGCCDPSTAATNGQAGLADHIGGGGGGGASSGFQTAGTGGAATKLRATTGNTGGGGAGATGSAGTAGTAGNYLCGGGGGGYKATATAGAGGAGGVGGGGGGGGNTGSGTAGAGGAGGRGEVWVGQFG